MFSSICCIFLKLIEIFLCIGNADTNRIIRRILVTIEIARTAINDMDKDSTPKSNRVLDVIVNVEIIAIWNFRHRPFSKR